MTAEPDHNLWTDEYGDFVTLRRPWASLTAFGPWVAVAVHERRHPSRSRRGVWLSAEQAREVAAELVRLADEIDPNRG